MVWFLHPTSSSYCWCSQPEIQIQTFPDAKQSRKLIHGLFILGNKATIVSVQTFEKSSLYYKPHFQFVSLKIFVKTYQRLTQQMHVLGLLTWIATCQCNSDQKQKLLVLKVCISTAVVHGGLVCLFLFLFLFSFLWFFMFCC